MSAGTTFAKKSDMTDAQKIMDLRLRFARFYRAYKKMQRQNRRLQNRPLRYRFEPRVLRVRAVA